MLKKTRNKKSRYFLLVWKTTDRKYQLVTGPDIADACNNAGIGAGALPALDFYSDVTTLVTGTAPRATLFAVASWGDTTYLWKRESCAKLARQGCGHILAEKDGGWVVAPGGLYLIERLKDLGYAK